MKASCNLPAILILTFFSNVYADDGPIGRDVSIVITNFSYIVDDVRSESLSAFASKFDENHGGSYDILVCEKTDASRLDKLFAFLKEHDPAAHVTFRKEESVDINICTESQ